MDEIERKLRMFYVLESKDRWDHLLIVADECEEKGVKWLAEALRDLTKSRMFAKVKVYGKKDPIDEIMFAIEQHSETPKPNLIDAIRCWHMENKGGVIFASTAGIYQ